MVAVVSDAVLFDCICRIVAVFAVLLLAAAVEEDEEAGGGDAADVAVADELPPPLPLTSSSVLSPMSTLHF